VIIFSVENGAVIEMYKHRDHAEIHARTITGSTVVPRVVRESLPDGVLDDIGSDDWNEDETPVVVMEPDLIETQPMTPRAKSKSKPP